MNATKTMAIVLMVAGAIALAYGGFTYTRTTHEMQMGPMSIATHERQTVAIPIWVGIAAVVVGGALLLVPARRS